MREDGNIFHGDITRNGKRRSKRSGKIKGKGLGRGCIEYIDSDESSIP